MSLNNCFVADFNKGFRNLVSYGLKSAAKSGSEYHCNYFHCLGHP